MEKDRNKLKIDYQRHLLSIKDISLKIRYIRIEN